MSLCSALTGDQTRISNMYSSLNIYTAELAYNELKFNSIYRVMKYF